MTKGDIYYYYKLTSNYTYKIIKRKYAGTQLDFDKIDLGKVYFRKSDCEKEARKTINLLKRSIKRWIR